jgi:hypothetical protein
MKGRMLPYVWQESEAMFKAALDEAASWTGTFFAGDAALTAECKNAVRLACALGRRKLQWANSLPYCLSRVHSPGMAAYCIQEFDKHQGHHPLSLSVLQPGSECRALVEAIPPGGCQRRDLPIPLLRRGGLPANS